MKNASLFSTNKSFRLLNIYERLCKGEYLSKSLLAKEYNVTAKTIQRDIDELRIYFADLYPFEKNITVKYDKPSNLYYLYRPENEFITNADVLIMCKLLLECRAFTKEELSQIVAKLMSALSVNDKKVVEKMIKSEYSLYIPPKHNSPLFFLMWQLSQAISQQKIMTFKYIRQDGLERTHTVHPVSVMFSEYYFYLIAFIPEKHKHEPIIFRIDKISDVVLEKETYYCEYKKRFSAGEFRKRVQFMYSGELQVIQFIYKGPSVEAILDKLPTAEIISSKDGAYRIKAEVSGDGIDMWLRSQGDKVEIIERRNI